MAVAPVLVIVVPASAAYVLADARGTSVRPHATEGVAPAGALLNVAAASVPLDVSWAIPTNAAKSIVSVTRTTKATVPTRLDSVVIFPTLAVLRPSVDSHPDYL